MVQGGDPTGTGDGGPDHRFPDEPVPSLRHDRAGARRHLPEGWALPSAQKIQPSMDSVLDTLILKFGPAAQ